MAIASVKNNDSSTGTLVLTGGKWSATSYTTTKSSNIIIPISITSQSQSANILDCSNHTFHITYSGTASTSIDSISPNGKCVAVTIDNCKDCTVVVDLIVLSSIEVINSRKCRVQVGRTSVPTVSIDNSEGVSLYLVDDKNDDKEKSAKKDQKEHSLPEFITCRASEVMIVKSSEKDPNEQVEVYIPEQFKTIFLEDGSVSTSPVQHTGA